MAKTRKCMDICVDGKKFICVEHMGEMNPYRLYKVWWDGRQHRKLIDAYSNFASVLAELMDYTNNNHWGF